MGLNGRNSGVGRRSGAKVRAMESISHCNWLQISALDIESLCGDGRLPPRVTWNEVSFGS